jgi:hypothetical protein
MEAYNGADRGVRFEIVEFIGVLAEHSTGWKKEINLVSWNGGTPKYDIRDWEPGHERMSKGITLNEYEMRHIFDLMKRRRQRHYNMKNEAAIRNLAKNDTASAAVHAADDCSCSAVHGEVSEEQEVMQTIAEERQ